MNSLIFFFKRLRSVGRFSHGLLVFVVALLFFCAMSTLPPRALADESVRLSAVRKAARVRFASLQALIPSHRTGLTETSMDRLLEMISDQEIAVAWRAAEMIGKHANRLDTNRLLPALSRPSVSVAATEALARMGSDARPAIPKLLGAFPAGSARGTFSRDSVEVALPIIGKPRAEDIPKLIAMLEGEIVGSEDCERRIQVLNVLYWAGASASTVADLLARIAVRDAALSAEQDKRWEAVKKTDRVRDFEDIRFGLSAQLAMASLWATTLSNLRDKTYVEYNVR